MIDLDTWAEIAATLGKNKLRTTLTALGVFWGIFMLIALLAIGDAFQRGIQHNMLTLSPNAIFVWGQATKLPYKGMQPGRPVEFDNGDIAAIERIPGIVHLAPRLRLGGWGDSNNVTRGARTGAFGVVGNYPASRHLLKHSMMAGRYLDPLDLAERRKVAVIGESVYRRLFAPGEDALGEDVAVRGVRFQVIGVFRPTGKGDEVDRESQSIFVPFTTFQQTFNAIDQVGWFSLIAERADVAERVEADIRRVLAARHTIDPADAEAIGSANVAKEVRKIDLLFLSIQILIWLVGAFTLLAGVLGVSNIMLIAVKERTRELGVRKALGATPGAIVRMVLAEALALTAIAGYLGFLAAVALVELGGPLLDGVGPLVAPRVDFSIAIFATLVLIAGGVLAGVIPALHAARIAPVEALRAE